MHSPHKITFMKKILSYFCTLITLLFLLACEKHSETLVLYTSQPGKEIAELLEAFQKKYPNIKIEVFRSGTTEVLNKVFSEAQKGEVHPDLIMISDIVAMESLSQKGILQFMDIDLSKFPSTLYSADKTYCGTKKINMGIIYRKGLSPVPVSFSDLTKPEYKDKVVIASPFYSGASALTLYVLIENPTLGWSFYKKLKANGATIVKGHKEVVESITNGKKSIGIVSDFLAFNAKEKGSPIEFAYPKEGIITLTEPIAFIKKKGASKDHLENARKFVEFVLSHEGQNLAKKQGYMPILEANQLGNKTISINIADII